MTTEKSLIVEGQVVVDVVQTTRPPTEVLAEAAEAAKALKDVVSKKPKKVMIRGKQYLEFEDWQTLARFYGLTVGSPHSTLINLDGVRGFEAYAEVHDRSGRVISSAESMCLRDEETWEKKPLFQLRSMAQTRACAKALRNCLAWVAVLAGYAPTPAEEMGEGEDTTPPDPTSPEAPKPKAVKLDEWTVLWDYCHKKGIKDWSDLAPILGVRAQAEWKQGAAKALEVVKKLYPE